MSFIPHIRRAVIGAQQPEERMSLTTKIERATRNSRYHLSGWITGKARDLYFGLSVETQKKIRTKMPRVWGFLVCGYYVKGILGTWVLKETRDWVDGFSKPMDPEQGVTFIDYDEDYNKLPPTGVTNRLPHWPSTN